MLPRSALLSLLLASLLAASALTQHLENDLQSLLHDLDTSNAGDDDFFYRPDAGEEKLQPPPMTVEGVGVRRLFGVSDTTATVGSLFTHQFLDDAFQGHVVKYQVMVPDWLYFDSRRRKVVGVARPTDRGHHYITVRAHGTDGSIAKDVFAVDVRELPGRALGEAGGCVGGRDVTLLSVVLGAHLPSMPARARVALLQAATRFFGGAQTWLLAAPHDFDPLADDSAILAGPGSGRRGGRLGREGLAQVQVVVGCEGDIHRQQQALVDAAEQAAKNGSLEEALGHPVLGWHVTQVQPATRRVRRQADGSGDNIENDDYDYNYDYYNYDTYDYGGEDDVGGSLNFDYEVEAPETRIIPSLSTPSFPEASATVVPGRGAGHQPDLVFTPVPVSTPVYVPGKPTRVPEASPTVVIHSVHPTLGPHSPNLEGSMSLQPSATVESTVPLIGPGGRATVPGGVQPTRTTIQPSAVPPVVVTTEMGPKNFPPRVVNRIQKLAWIAGHLYRLHVPEDTFEDVEDGNTRNLKLLFKDSHGMTVGRNSWIQYDPSKQEIYALPLEENIGRYTYMLEAMDSEGKSITDSIMIHVQQARQARNYNHHFEATFTLDKQKEYEFVYSLDWQVKAVEKVAMLYGDNSTDNINVRAISVNPTRLTWTNVTLTDPRSTTCPSDQLQQLAKVVISDGHKPTKDFKRIFGSEFQLKHVSLHYKGQCEHLHKGHHKPRMNKTEESAGTGDDYNNPPIIRNQIDLLNATQGVLFRFKVPIDTCYDLEDGNSQRLMMRLLTSDVFEPSADSWLQFDAANQEFFGIPLASDTGKKQYILECVDAGGLKVNDALFVNVLSRPSRHHAPVEFGMTISTDYSEFMNDGHLKARLVERIGQAFEDEGAQHVVVESFERGSVVVRWTNGSLPTQPCPHQAIAHLRSLMLDSNGNLLRSFVEAFTPEFTVVEGSMESAGACLGEDTPTHKSDEKHRMPTGTEVPPDEEDDYLLTFIVPAVIIAAMLLLAAIVACCLYRRRRYGKMTMADDRTFVSKGIPIIFAEELDDRPEHPAKSPVIMKEEKPPLPPPEYQRGGGSSPPPASATPPGRRRPHSGEPGDDAPSYQPPPPFTATNGASRHPRPNMPPTYRKPPTYVPP